jgi:cyclopropane fatty-acyl-phospholipid synthase-like methyltransferase
MYRTDMEFTGERVVPDKTPQTVYDEHIYRYIFAAGLTQQKAVLDVACGTGYGLSYMAEKRAGRAVGVDLSWEAVSYARERFGGNGRINFICADGTRMPFADGSFDVIVSFETIEHIKKYGKFLAECRRVLKQGGLLVCSTPNRRIFSPHLEKPINTFHVKEFWPDEFHRLLSRYFTEVTFYGQCDVRLADNSVDRSDYSVHGFIDDECTSSGYIIAVARKRVKRRKTCQSLRSQ